MMSRSKKETVIILPNKDKLSIGKIKEVSKILDLVSAEYGIANDIKYFTIKKEKYLNMLKLQFIPRKVSEIYSVNAKKFVIFELAKMGYNCVMKIDDELNKKALVIIDLISSIDDFCKETINSKLNTMLDIPGELDNLLDRMITDPQFNSIKYTVLDESKTNFLLCVNGDGLFVRSLDNPYEVIKQLLWQDIDAIKTKRNKLIFHKQMGQNEELLCINKKTVSTAHDLLLRYFEFLRNKDSNAYKEQRSSWFESFASRIRQSFSRHSRTYNSEPVTSIQPTQSKSLSSHYQEQAPLNSNIPGSSIVSEDFMDTTGSMIEPSIKTNSTHNVSLGSENSFRPCTSYNDQNNQSLVRLNELEDHMSVKTTSTYEVSLERGTSLRTLSNVSRGENDSSSVRVASFGESSAKKSPTLNQLEEADEIKETSEELILPSTEIPKYPIQSHESKIIPVPTRILHTAVCEIQPPFQPVIYYPEFKVVESTLPLPPMRSADHDIDSSLELSMATLLPTEHPIIFMQTEINLNENNDNISKCMNLKKEAKRTSDDCNTIVLEDSNANDLNGSDKINLKETPLLTEYEDIQSIRKHSIPVILNDSTLISLENASSKHLVDPAPVTLNKPILVTSIKESFLNDPKDSETIDTSDFMKDIKEPYREPKIQESDSQLDDKTKETNIAILENKDVTQVQNQKLMVDEELSLEEHTKVGKLENKFPVSRKKSIPSPKIKRPSRIPSVSSSKDPPSPKSSPSPTKKAPSPSDKENFNSTVNKDSSIDKYPDFDNAQGNNDNFTRFENEEYTLDSKTTITSVSTVGDSITKKSTKTEISSVRSSGIPAPKQYKTTTTITSTVKKPSNSPMITASKSSGIPRMASK